MKQFERGSADENLAALAKNTYPGRIIMVGRDKSSDNLVQAYAIMGRSANSRNRLFVKDEFGFISTTPADATKVEDPSLIIYKAMVHRDSIHVVSNGHQTEDAAKATLLQAGLSGWTYEPDFPNNTPRITASFDLGRDYPLFASMAILKKSPFSEVCDKHFYELDVSKQGIGYCFHTYENDGNPLPSFSGDPYLVPLSGDNSKAVAENIWSYLNEENRISLVVKFINFMSGGVSTHIINKYEVVV